MNRMTSIRTIFAAVTLAVAATACALQPSVTGPSTPPEATPAASVTPAVTQPLPEPTVNTPDEPAAGDAKTVTLDDQGKTIQLGVGQSFLLKLGEDYDWQVTASDQNVVSRARNIAVVRGAQGVYDAHQAGTVTLTASGDPACRQSQPPCAMPSMLFTVTIVVM
jgi:hypothetical protein